MTNEHLQMKKEDIVKRFLAAAMITVAMMTFAAAPALAEGYNDGGWNFGNASSGGAGYDDPDHAGNAGIYVRTATGASQVATNNGPHGDYATTTNKCQDCHSTHYATGGYMLLRAANRENACTFCHSGGGGSSINIQMDNAYNAEGAETTTTRGLGTGHTLGYKGKAPADTNPAFSDSSGFACFDCHSPHGNSARIVGNMADPGRALYDVGTVEGHESRYFVSSISVGAFKKYTSNATSSQVATQMPNLNGAALTGPFPRALTAAEMDANFYKTADGRYDLSSITTNSGLAGGVFFGYTKEGNLVINLPAYSVQSSMSGLAGPDARCMEIKPIFKAGKFLLIANPDNEAGYQGMSGDQSATTDASTAVAGAGPDGAPTTAPNKMAVVWGTKANNAVTDLLGPADKAYGGYQDTDNDRGVPGAPNGLNMLSEFCMDCHDGAGGSSTQSAKVWLPNSSTNNEEGSYVVAHSHDVQPRHCYRQMWLDAGEGTSGNEGPHCRNCHAGGSSCNQCHGGGDNTRNYQNEFFAVQDSIISSPYATPYRGQAYAHTNGVTTVADKCVDGGFSWPHRTLGVNMLKDELWGVDFDGKKIAANEVRMDSASLLGRFGAQYLSNYAYDWGDSMTSEVSTDAAGDPITAGNTVLKFESGEQLVGKAAENLDSACIDCHGDATSYNGDNPAAFYREGKGWELMFKGLP